MTGAAARFKQKASDQAAPLVQSGMVVCLGTGSTAIFGIRPLGARLRSNDLSDILASATSRATEARPPRALGVPMLTDNIPREIDLTNDGSDDVNPALDLIEVGGGALEDRGPGQSPGVIVVDAGKLSPGSARSGRRR